MKKKLSIISLMLISLIFFVLNNNSVEASSYLSDKTEIVVDLDVAGAEALCQTEDGYVWIGQYAGLTRYDSKEKTTYKSFEEDGVSYDIINVRSIESFDNVLYVLTYKNVYKYENNTFSTILKGADDVKSLINITGEKFNLELYDVELDVANKKLYISSNSGLFIYDLVNKNFAVAPNTENNDISDSAVNPKTGDYYYIKNDGVYSKKGLIYEDDASLDLYSYNDTLLIATTTGVVRYNLATNALDSRQYDIVTGQVNTTLYWEKNNTVFLATDNEGLISINDETFEYSIADNLSNGKQLTDVMIDYENNIWVASHNVSSSGVSIITKNALVDLLSEDEKWINVPNKQVNAVDKIGNNLYICSKSGLYTYDVTTGQINDDSNIIMTKLDEYITSIGLETTYHDFRDVELFKGDIYFTIYGVGVLKYSPSNSNVVMYGDEFISNEANILAVHGTPLASVDALKNVRVLRAFDNFLAIGYQKGGVIKLQDEKYTVYNSGKNVVFINKSADGKILVDQTDELYTLSDDLSTKITIPTETNVVGNRLKFLVDGNKIYYTLNSRLFCYETTGSEYKNYEIDVPKVKGSIVELAKVKISDDNYKYVLTSQSQVYIIDSLTTTDNKVENYEIYDSTNGLAPIAANSSGYYDEVNKQYYFQTTEGVSTYNFNVSSDDISPLKIAIKEIEVDSNKLYGDNFTIDKTANRLVFNLAVLGFRPNKGYSVYYKLDGVDEEYKLVSEGQNSVSYTNLSGGNYVFHAYAVDEFGQESNEITINITKPKKTYEQAWFWVLMGILALIIIGAINFLIIWQRSKLAKKREAELKGITLESIEAIARTIDAKDTYTNGHSIRVGHYSRVIAKELGIEGSELENLYYIALLHDIGKIGIPDAILNKPGKLTDEEFAIMKSHTTKGAKILKDISTIPNIVEGAKYHHEKYGGGGYPEGLKGEEIPYIARIICCADCFDAMATRRVYKDPYPKEKIISEFERCKGTQFDPAMADVVIKLISEGKLKAEDNPILKFDAEKNDD